ncbi:hypothetical protein LTR37_020317 [Vermiconidia calcicola]|uniref:Uncharacterized protein n=1 Tax=Vermiconidia calcicola TaxID=1690605 RepID=A0ACC3MBL1_9PEZI|nr:hypothetical protein LTR37_020317 [Vermiconidia calcicola]
MGDVYIVNGAKKWVTNGIFADYCTAAVRTGKAGRDGISALVIALKASGVAVRAMQNSGVSASGSTYIEFDDVEVPVVNLLGRENPGFEIIMSKFNHERLWLACTSLRMARCCVEDAYAYANNRETFGHKLISNQTIQAKFSAMGRAIEPAHAYMEQLLGMMMHNGPAANDPYLGGLVASLKVQAGRTLGFVVREAQQVLGGVGYSRTGKGARVEQISRVMVVGGGSEEVLESLAIKQEMKAVRETGRL